jgi:hypothetical protein
VSAIFLPGYRAGNVAAMGAAAASFAPTDLSGLKLYLKPDAGISSGLSNPVALWGDQSGNGNDASQSVAGSQPVLTASVQNGLSMVLLDGSNDYLAIDSVVPFLSGTGTEFTLWGVFKQLDDVAAGQYQVLWGGDGLTNGSYADVEVTATGATGSGPLMESNSNAGQYSNDGQLSDTFTDGRAHIVVAVFTASVLKLWVDGVAASAGSVGSAQLASPPQTTTVDTYSLGAFRDSGAPSLFFHGYLGDHGLYSRALDATEVGQLSNSLKTRWGVF